MKNDAISQSYNKGTKTKVDLSVVVPVYRSKESLNELFMRLNDVLLRISSRYEIILVNDASPDGSWQIIQELACEDNRVRGINLSRNFGQHYAITAGLDHVRGDWVVVMDCDLQDVPEEIPKLYNKAQEGYDLVVGRRILRQDTFLKKIGSKFFYSVFAYLTGSRIDNRIGNFGIYSRKVIQSILALKEQNRSFGMFALWVGFRRIEVDIEHARRPHGKSSYTFKRMVSLALDSIVAHSNKLLRFSVKLGFFLSFSSLLYALWLVARYFVWANPVVGWTSLMVSVYFTAGLIIGTIGIMGLYVGKIFDEVKARPLYIIDSTTFEINSDRD
jgi:polyisoprenyl-phosphate glycosyltransferase